MEVVILPAHSPLYEFMELEQAGAGWDAKDTVDRGIDIEKYNQFMADTLHITLKGAISEVNPRFKALTLDM